VESLTWRRAQGLLGVAHVQWKLRGWGWTKETEVTRCRRGGRWPLLLVMCLAIALGLPGCATSKSPGAVVREFFGLMSSGRYEAASQLLTADARAFFAFGISLAALGSQFTGEKLGSMPAGTIEITREVIRGDTAEVEGTVRYADGTVEPMGFNTLVMENGQWKIALDLFGTGARSSGSSPTPGTSSTSQAAPRPAGSPTTAPGTSTASPNVSTQAGSQALETPGDVARQFFVLTSRGNYEAAAALMTDEAKMLFAFGAFLTTGLSGLAGEEAGFKPIAEVEITREVVQGDTAEVECTLHYADGTTDPVGSVALARVDGQWRIAVDLYGSGVQTRQPPAPPPGTSSAPASAPAETRSQSTTVVSATRTDQSPAESPITSGAVSPAGVSQMQAAALRNVQDGQAEADLPAGAIARLGLGVGCAIQYSPDGRWLAVATLVGIEMWRSATLELAWRRVGEGPAIRGPAVAFSPDGKIVASGSGDGTIELREVATGALDRTLSGQAGVWCIAFSPDGRTLAAGSLDQTVELWDMATGVLTRTLSISTEQTAMSLGFHNISFSPDGKTLAASGYDDSTVKLWDVTAGSLLRTLSGHTGPVNSVAFSPDGRTIASAGFYDMTVKLWDAATGALLHTLSGHTGYVWSVDFSPDGKVVASGSDDRTIKLWDAATGKPLRALSGCSGSVYSAVFSPDGRSLASGSHDDGMIGVWDTDTGTLLRGVSAHTTPVSSIAFSPNGKLLASVSEGAATVWNVATREPLHTLALASGSTGGGLAFSFSPDGTATLASVSSNSGIKLWNAATGAEVRTLIGHTWTVRCAAFSPAGTLLASGSNDRTIKLWDAASGAVLRTVSGLTALIQSIAFSPDGKMLVSAFDTGTIELRDVGTMDLLRSISSQRRVLCISFSPDEKTLAAGTNAGTVKLSDVATGAELRTLAGHSSFVNSVSFSPDGTLLASGSQDHTVKLWDVATGGLLRTISAHTNGVTAVAFSPDGKTLASASNDGTVLLWDTDGMLESR